MTCPHLSRIGTRCTRPEGHTGPHVAGFTKERDVKTPSNRAPRIARPCTHGGIHEHGTRVAYVKDRCRCEDCTTASRVAEQKRRRARLYGIDAGLVDAQPVRDHLAVLSEAGIGYKRASELAGVSLTVVQTILYHHPDRPDAGPAKRVKRETAEKILAVQPLLDHVRDHTPVPSRGAARRIQALVARGWSQAKIAERAGITDQRMRPILDGVPANARTVRAINALYEELWDQAPPESTHRDKVAASRARGRAARMGWVPPAAWDDIDHDESPYQGADIRATSEDRLDELEFLIGAGTPAYEAVTRAGFPSMHSAERAAYRAGRGGLASMVNRAVA